MARRSSSRSCQDEVIVGLASTGSTIFAMRASSDVRFSAQRRSRQARRRGTSSTGRTVGRPPTFARWSVGSSCHTTSIGGIT